MIYNTGVQTFGHEGFFNPLPSLHKLNIFVAKSPSSTGTPVLAERLDNDGKRRRRAFVMWFIPLTQGQLAMVDDEDYERVSQYKWYAHWHPQMGNYVARTNTSRQEKPRKQIYMHRMILSAPSGKPVDHIRHDTLDNRRDNLRVCTIAENNRNAKKYRGTTSSRYKGVYWDAANSSWQVRIGSGGHIWVGRFRDEVRAALAYDVAALERFGEFALTNFLVEGMP